MTTEKIVLNTQVTKLIESLQHPLAKEIEVLRILILTANAGLSENIKWNSPNYAFENQDRITIRIQPTKQLQLIFHRGAKVREQPTDKLINEDFGVLKWKENDRAIATFKNIEEIEKVKIMLTTIINQWIKAAS